MSNDSLTAAFQRYLRSTDELILAYLDTEKGATQLPQKILSHENIRDAKCKELGRWLCWMNSGAPDALKAARTRAWLSVHVVKGDYLKRMQSLFTVACEQSQVAVAYPLEPRSTTLRRRVAVVPYSGLRQCAWAALQVASETAIGLLSVAADMANALRGYSSDPADHELAYKALAAMAHRDFLAAVGQAADGLVATVRLLHSDPTLGRKLRLIGTGAMDGMVLHEALASEAVAQAAGLLDLAMELLVHQMDAIPESPRATAKEESSIGGSTDSGSGSGSGGEGHGGSGSGNGSSGGSRSGSGDNGGSNSGGSGGNGSRGSSGSPAGRPAGSIVGSSGSGRPSIIPSGTVDQIVAVLDSQLSECVAGLILAFPDPAENAAVLPKGRRHGIRKELCEAARRAAAALLKMVGLRMGLQDLQDAKGWELASNLHHVARHTNVQLLQVALLDQLAAHAGMGAELQGQQEQQEWTFDSREGKQEEEAEVEAQESGTGQSVVQGAEKEGEERQGPVAGEEGVVEQGTAAREEGAGEQEGREGQRRDEGEQGMESEAWDGSSGLWWVAKEEVRLGKTTKVYKDVRAARDARLAVGPTGLLKRYHTDIVYSCLGDWTSGCHEMVEDAGLPSRPYPVLQAQHACRAAEALCRLFRGQGLGGAYGRALCFEGINAEGLKMCSECIIPYKGFAAAMPVDIAQKCLPLWLEAAGWVVATAVDATAAAVGTWPQQGQQEPTGSSTSSTQDGQAGSVGCPEATWLCEVVQQLQQLAANCDYGYETLPPAAQADVRRRLFRCGLAASLDRTLRMLYSAQDGGRADIATALEGVAAAGGTLLEVAPVLQPSSPTVEEGGSSDGNTAATAADGSKGTVTASGKEEGGTSGGYSGEAVAAAEAPGDQLGVVLTLSKRAALLTRALEVVSLPQGGATEAAAAGAVAGGGTGGVGRWGAAASAAGAEAAEGTGAGALERGPVVRWAGITLSALVAAARGMEGELVCKAEGAGATKEADMGEGEPCGEDADSIDGGSGGGIKAWGGVSVCEGEAHEALALAARAASNLAAPLAWQLAVGTRTAADGAVRQDEAAVLEVVRAVGDLLFLMAGCCRHPAPLPAAQLLACQPHRLLAAACALAAAALPEEKEQEQGPRQGKSDLCAGIVCLLVALSSHEVLSERVRSWLAPPPPLPPAATAITATADACTAGCLAACVQSAMQLARSLVPVHAAHGLALLRMAAGGGTKGAPGQGSGAGSAGGDGAAEGVECTAEDAEEYRIRAARMAAMVCRAECREGPSNVERESERLGDLLPAGCGTNDEMPPPSTAVPTAAEAGALPVPLALPVGWARGAALPRLRVCGGPRCCNFASESEGALTFKQCGGCRAVRYCGADCQRAHWREGHRAECKALAAGAV